MYVVVSALLLIVLIGTLVDILTRPDEQVRHLPKFAWAILVVLIPLIGIVLWFLLGRETVPERPNVPFGHPSRWESRPTTPSPVASAVKTTEQQLADLDREIEFYEQQAKIKRLEAELEERRRNAE